MLGDSVDNFNCVERIPIPVQDAAALHQWAVAGAGGDGGTQPQAGRVALIRHAGAVQLYALGRYKMGPFIEQEAPFGTLLSEILLQ